MFAHVMLTPKFELVCRRAKKKTIFPSCLGRVSPTLDNPVYQVPLPIKPTKPQEHTKDLGGRISAPKEEWGADKAGPHTDERTDVL